MKIPRGARWLALLPLLTMASCAPVNRLMKSKPVKQRSAFIAPSLTPVNETARSAWHYAAFTTDDAKLAALAKRKGIFIAPVATSGTRPVSKKLAAAGYAGERPAQLREISADLRREFARALGGTAASPWRTSLRPGKDTLILEMNLLELDPTSAPGNVTKTAVKFTVGPLASTAVGLFTKGCIAIEGRLRDGATGAVIMQFADKEKDKATFYSVRDYLPLGHAKKTTAEWADQAAAFLRDRRAKVKDSFFFTPYLY